MLYIIEPRKGEQREAFDLYLAGLIGRQLWSKGAHGGFVSVLHGLFNNFTDSRQKETQSEAFSPSQFKTDNTACRCSH